MHSLDLASTREMHTGKNTNMFITSRACVKRCITTFLRPLDWDDSSLFKVMESNSSSHLVGINLSSSSLILTFLLWCYFINIPLTLLAGTFNQQSLCISIMHSLRNNIAIFLMLFKLCAQSAKGKCWSFPNHNLDLVLPITS